MGKKRLELVSTFEVLAHVVKNAQDVGWVAVPGDVSLVESGWLDVFGGVGIIGTRLLIHL